MAITAAVREANANALSPAEADEDAAGRKGKVKLDGLEAFARLFAGDELKDVIEEKTERKI